MASKQATLGERLKAAREMVQFDGEKLSGRELARIAKVPHSLVGQIERGDRHDHGVTSVEKIASVLGVSLDWLVKGAGREPSKRDVQRAAEQAKRMVDAAETRAS